MSRIGKQPIAIPAGVDVRINNREVTIKGPKGQLQWEVPDVISVKTEDKQVVVTRKDDSKQQKALHGLARSVLSNMVSGVSDGFKKEMELVGVGYRAQSQGKKIVFNLGHSHPIEYELPEGVQAKVDKKQTKITLSGIDKQLLGQVAANMKALRMPDAYKGKGIRFADERIRLKPGKTAK